MKERAEKLKNWRMKEKTRDAKNKEKRELIRRKSSLWIDEENLEKNILQAIVDVKTLWGVPLKRGSKFQNNSKGLNNIKIGFSSFLLEGRVFLLMCALMFFSNLTHPYCVFSTTEWDCYWQLGIAYCRKKLLGLWIRPSLSNVLSFGGTKAAAGI